MANEPETLGEMSHANPYTGQVFGQTQTYGRGKMIAADGGEADTDTDIEADAADADADAKEDAETLADLSHEAPEADDADGTQRTFNRGEQK